MAAGEDQAQAFVRNFVEIVSWLGYRSEKSCGYVGIQLFLEARLPPDAVDRFMTRGLNNPGARVFRNTGRGPLVHCSGEGFLSGFFGGIEVAENTNQNGHDAAPVRAIESLQSGGRGRGPGGRRTAG